MTKITTEFKFYDVEPNRAAQLKITVGNGQVGATKASIGTKRFVDEDDTTDRDGWKDSWTIKLPKGKDLDGKMLFVTTVVADVRQETDETSVTYDLTGGVSDFHFTLSERVAQPGGIVIYNLTVKFIATS